MHLITNIHRVSQGAKDVLTSILESEGVTTTQLIVLHALAEREYDKQTELVVDTGIDRSTMTDVINRLIRQGLVVRKSLRRDARAKSPRITHKGRMLVVRAMVAIPRIEAEIQARYPEVRALRRLGSKLKRAA